MPEQCVTEVEAAEQEGAVMYTSIDGDGNTQKADSPAAEAEELAPIRARSAVKACAYSDVRQMENYSKPSSPAAVIPIQTQADSLSSRARSWTSWSAWQAARSSNSAWQADSGTHGGAWATVGGGGGARSRGGGGRNLAYIWCHNCGGQGHKADVCPSAR